MDPIRYSLIAGGFFCLLALAAWPLRAAGPVAPSLSVPDAWPPEEAPGDAEKHFLEAAMEFLTQEEVDPKTVDVEIKSLGPGTPAPASSWKALAQVIVDNRPGGGYIRKLIFDQSYWLGSGTAGRSVPHRWTKLMWHEVHHLKFFPLNLQRSRQLMKTHAAKRKVEPKQWERQWVALLEPLEELAAERESLARYKAAFGPVPEELMIDSRADMLKHAARYDAILAELLNNARRPARVRKAFPKRLPIDKQGNILPGY